MDETTRKSKGGGKRASAAPDRGGDREPVIALDLPRAALSPAMAVLRFRWRVSRARGAHAASLRFAVGSARTASTTVAIFGSSAGLRR